MTMAKAPRLRVPHNVRVNDKAYFLIQKKNIEARENGSTQSTIEITSNIIIGNRKD